MKKFVNSEIKFKLHLYLTTLVFVTLENINWLIFLILELGR